MKLRRIRIPIPALFAVVASLLMFLLSTAWADGGSGSAAAVVPTVINPVSDPNGFLSELAAFAHTNLWLAIALGAYGVLEIAASAGKNIAALAWLGKGRLTLVIGGGIAVIGAALSAYFGSASVQGALVAAVVAMAAYWHPQATEVAVAKSARTAQAGSISMFMSTLLAFAFAAFVVCLPYIAACSWGKTEVKKAETAIVDCTVGEYAQLEAIAAADAPLVLNGSLTWATVGDAAIKAGTDIGGCFLTRVLTDVEALAAASAGSGAKTSSAAGIVQLARFREALKTKAKYHLESGDR